MLWLKRGLDTPARRDQGLVLVLPGIEGRSLWNASIANGLAEAGVPQAMRIWDWTTGWPIPLYHLVAWERNQRQADLLATEIVRYTAEYPQRPVWLIGHSGGGALSLLTLARLHGKSTNSQPVEELPREQTPQPVSRVRAEGAILLAPAISPHYDAESALSGTRRGVWNFHSHRDMFFLGLGTSVMGTLDRRFGVSAGLVGFQREPDLGDGRRLRNIPYQSQMFYDWHFGGHFGCVARKFVRRWIAPIVLGADG